MEVERVNDLKDNSLHKKHYFANLLGQWLLDNLPCGIGPDISGRGKPKREVSIPLLQAALAKETGIAYYCPKFFGQKLDDKGI